MTYKQYIAACQRKQRACIRSERSRYARAFKAWSRYDKAMRALNLHVLTQHEIYDRKHELDRMEKDVAATHGDTAAMRSLYEMREGK